MNKMKAILAILAIVLLLTTCSAGHSITVTSGKHNLVSCPKRAKAGETFTVETSWSATRRSMSI